MIARFTALLLGLIHLVACSGYSSNEQEAVDRIKEQLFDADSAQFRNVHEVDRKGGWLVCGEVNSKNRFGGYVGFRRFSMTEKEGDVLFSGDSNVEELASTMLIDSVCKFPKKS